ncbi:MAG TPA: hypothetical protein VFC84_03535 [Desulfosporosinus sp.]|nr:hypothetical protein [Desulfosporosinus sp.]
MNHAGSKNPSVAVHPKLRRILLSRPTQESLSAIIKYQLFDKPNRPLEDDILSLLHYWELQACAGNEVLAALIEYMIQHSPRLLKKALFVNIVGKFEQ